MGATCIALTVCVCVCVCPMYIHITIFDLSVCVCTWGVYLHAHVAVQENNVQVLCAAYLNSDTSYTCKHGRTCTRAQLAERVQSTARASHWMCANVDSFSHTAHSPTSSVHSDEVSCLIDRGSCPVVEGAACERFTGERVASRATAENPHQTTILYTCTMHVLCTY